MRLSAEAEAATIPQNFLPRTRAIRIEQLLLHTGIDGDDIGRFGERGVDEMLLRRAHRATVEGASGTDRCPEPDAPCSLRGRHPGELFDQMHAAAMVEPVGKVARSELELGPAIHPGGSP